MKIRNNVKPTLPPIPGGTYLAICVYSIGIGEQLCEYEGKSKNYYNQVMFGFEICGQTVEIDGKQEPRVLGKTFNATKGKKSGLRKFIGAWEAKELTDDEYLDKDTNDYVGRAALLTVVLNETGEYSNIDGIAPLPEGIPISVPQPLSKLIRFDVDNWNQAAFEALPEWAQERIKKSTQYQKEHISVETVAVQGVQQVPLAGQIPQNIPGINFQAVMQQMAAQTQAAPVQQFTQNVPVNNAGGGECPI